MGVIFASVIQEEIGGIYMKLRKYALTFLAGTALGLAGCGGGNSSKTDVVNRTELQEMSTLDSTLSQDTTSGNFIGQVQAGLYWEDEKNQPQPDLATELPKVSEDGLTHTIKMRQDAKWSNGDKITAHDFVYAIHRLVDPKVGAAYSYLLDGFENSEEVLAGKATVDKIGVKALDDYTIEIKLSKPLPYLNHLLAFCCFSPLNQKFVEEKGDRYGTSSDNSIASGPFQVTDWDGTGLKFKLKKNPNFYNADKVKLNEINVQVIKENATAANLFENGEVDNALLRGEVVKQYKGNPSLQYRPQASTYYIQMNHEHPALKNKDFRQAIAHAINNEELANKIKADGSTAISTFIPRDFIFNPETGADFVDDANIPSAYDVNKAKEKWEKAKAELGKSEISVKLLCSDDEGSKKVGEYIQGQIQNTLSGVHVDLVTLPGKNRIAKVNNKDYDMALSGWSADYADASNFFDLFKTGNAYNRSNYSNAQYDALLKKASIQDAENPAARWQDFLKAQKLFTEDVPAVVLYQAKDAELRNPRVKGIVYRSGGVDFDYRSAYIDKDAK